VAEQGTSGGGAERAPDAGVATGRRGTVVLVVVGLLVPLAVGLGLVVGPRTPGVVLGVALLLLALLRLVAPASAAGPLAVRSGPVDAVVAGTLGTVLLVLSLTTPTA
jgi:hypothetical protein